MYVPYFVCSHVILNPEKKSIPPCKECKLSGKRTRGITIKVITFTDQNFMSWYFTPVNEHEKVNSIIKRYKQYILDNRKKLKREISAYWRSFYILKSIIQSSLNYAYAITCHKSQGSQYDHVFVNIDNIRRCQQSHRLAYTAVSRAVETIQFI